MKSHWPKIIIHVDMDAFFASIEVRDHPEYRGKPVVVGGDPYGRGVVSTASYEARKFGIHSAMSAAAARRLCPAAVFLRPNFQKYSEVSKVILEILHQHTDLVEAVSIDEAYLDVTHHRFGIEDPAMIASLIKQNIFAVTRLTASAGAAPNLFLAKIASDFKKPDGLTVIPPDQIQIFLDPLPVRKIPGVGPVTDAELARLGIRTCRELADADVSFLARHFGKLGQFLWERARGLDDREVEPYGEPKQYSMEETFPHDILDIAWLKMKLKNFSQEIFDGLKTGGRMGRTVVLKVKYFDFELITRSRTLLRPPSTPEEIEQVGCELLEKKTLAGKKPVRLIGLGISGLLEMSPHPADKRQKDLFEMGFL